MPKRAVERKAQYLSQSTPEEALSGERIETNPPYLPLSRRGGCGREV
jgi:hypothetical protein